MRNKDQQKTNELHLFDPKNVEVLEARDRNARQNPDEILKHLDLKKSQIVVDLGCGSGYFSIPISKKVKKLYAIDVQQEMLDYLEKKIQLQKIGNIETLLSQGNTIPLKDESADVLLTVNTLHEFRNKEKMSNEIHRVLKHNGRAVIVDFKKENTDFGPPLAIRVSKDEAISLFEKHGLSVVTTQNLTHDYLLVLQKN